MPSRAGARSGPSIEQTEVVTLLLMLALLAGGHVLVPLLDGPALRTWSTILVAVVVQSLPFLVMGVLLSGVLSVLLSERVLSRVVPRNPVMGVPVAGLAGVGLPGCECAAVPIAGSLMRRGVPPAVALTFLLAAPAVNPTVLVSTAVAFPGQPAMVLARLLASLLTAMMVGWLFLSRGARMPVLRKVADLAHLDARARFVAVVRHDFLHAAGFLVIGAMLAAAMNTFVPRSVVDTVAEQAVLGILTMAAFAFLVALCSESDAFVAASFTGFSDTAKLTFLVVGPAMDVKLAAMEAGQFGAAFARAFVPLVVSTAVLSSVAVGWWLL